MVPGRIRDGWLSLDSIIQKKGATVVCFAGISIKFSLIIRFHATDLPGLGNN